MKKQYNYESVFWYHRGNRVPHRQKLIEGLRITTREKYSFDQTLSYGMN